MLTLSLTFLIMRLPIGFRSGLCKMTSFSFKIPRLITKHFSLAKDCPLPSDRGAHGGAKEKLDPSKEPDPHALLLTTSPHGGGVII